MFVFCQRRLGLSEDQACRRIAVARLGRKFPQVFAAVGAGRLHLSSADKLEAHFTAENVDTLIAEASGKTMREVELFIAKLAPKPHVPESIRKLPRPHLVSPAVTQALGFSSLPQAPIQAPLVPVEQPSLPQASIQAPLVPVAQSLTLKPLSETGYRLTLTAGTALHDDLMKLRALMKREIPKGDLLPILEAAVALLLKKLEAEKLGKTPRPRQSKGPAAADAANAA